MMDPRAYGVCGCECQSTPICMQSVTFHSLTSPRKCACWCLYSRKAHALVWWGEVGWGGVDGVGWRVGARSHPTILTHHSTSRKLPPGHCCHDPTSSHREPVRLVRHGLQRWYTQQARERHGWSHVHVALLLNVAANRACVTCPSVCDTVKQIKDIVS